MKTAARTLFKKIPGDVRSTLVVAASALPMMALAMTLVLAAPAQATDDGRTAQGAPRDPRTRALIDAVKAGRVDAVKALVRQGANVDAGIDGDGTALIAAARAGKLDMVEALLGLRAKVDLAWRGDGNPLIAAASAGHERTVERLIRAGADVNAVCFMDETPLINAVRGGSLASVKQLVEHGAKVNLGAWADGKRWRTPLSQARDKTIRAYLVEHGATA